ncbi:MAG: response regulator [Deltaproteobacteria bacterium]|nr:response regulator [Deltaproteobacteria bacterium]
MEKEKTIMEELEEDIYDAADRPFDFVGADEQTAIICEANEGVRGKICNILKGMDFQITEVSSALEALRNMRYHEYDLVVVNEKFDVDKQDDNINNVLNYLENLPMTERRNIFVVLLSETLRTMDNMAAFHQSVHLVINTQNLDDFENILNRGIAINEVFYSMFKEGLRKLGRY